MPKNESLAPIMEDYTSQDYQDDDSAGKLDFELVENFDGSDVEVNSEYYRAAGNAEDNVDENATENAEESTKIGNKNAVNQDLRLVNSYFKELGSEPLLKPREEFKFGAKIFLCDRVADSSLRFISELTGKKIEFDSDIDLNTTQEKVLELLDSRADTKANSVLRKRIIRLFAISKTARDRSEQLKSRFIKSNLRLVAKIAKDYMGRGLPFLDLVQEGNLGLIKAVEKYDFRKGFRFSTYACWWINQAMSRAVFYQTRTIRVPAYVFEKYSKVKNTFNDMEDELGRKPLPAEIAKRLEMTTEGVKRVLSVNERVVRLDTPIWEGESLTLMDMVSDQNAKSADNMLSEAVLPASIQDALDILTPREREVVTMRFGIGYDSPLTLDMVGNHLGLTRERIRQIQKHALQRLEKSESAEILKSLLGH